jgi:hypothetical protein
MTHSKDIVLEKLIAVQAEKEKAQKKEAFKTSSDFRELFVKEQTKFQDEIRTRVQLYKEKALFQMYADLTVKWRSPYINLCFNGSSKTFQFASRNLNLEVLTWDCCHLEFKNDSYFFDKPKVTSSEKFIFDVSTDLKPIWFINNTKIEFDKIIEKAFLNLIDLSINYKK